MSWGIIATWAMAIHGVYKGAKLIKEDHSSLDGTENAIMMVEDDPLLKSVGYGGLPNEEGVVEMDAAFMDGDTLSIGAVAGIRDYKNPVSIARRLSKEKYNAFLVGEGAEKFAHKMGFERKNMLIEESEKIWQKEILNREEDLKAYDGHDTVGVVSLDKTGTMSAATSTSGLFMKKPGRVGDSPLCGSGFYVDSEIGGAVATGLGEDIMKGCVSYEIVRLMKEGLSPQEAAERAVLNFNDKLIRYRGKAEDISVVCMNSIGEWGAATNIDEFSFSVCTDKMEPKIYIAKYEKGSIKISLASKGWIEEYNKRVLK